MPLPAPVPEAIAAARHGLMSANPFIRDAARVNLSRWIPEAVYWLELTPQMQEAAAEADAAIIVFLAALDHGSKGLVERDAALAELERFEEAIRDAKRNDMAKALGI